MIDWKEFIECNRALLIAPAGHGKTTAIADCLLSCPENSCQLVLTHTHAGIASLRTKFRQKNIPTNKYQLETITGFAQRYVLSYLGSTVLPSEEDKEYFSIAVNKCCDLLKSNIIQFILKASYNRIFVDEYQDCTIDQHNMIMNLAHSLPLHVLGDPLQGIFFFENKPLVDFKKDLDSFKCFKFLNHPWRWEKSNPALGQCILNIRKCLETNQTITLENRPKDGFHVIKCNANDDKYKCLGKLIQYHDSDNLLVICPSYKEYDQKNQLRFRGNLNDRIRIKQRVDYANKFFIVDAIDSSEYYKCAKAIDAYLEKCRQGRKICKIAHLHNILENLHLNMTEVNKWINKKNNSLKKRTKENASFSIAIKESFSFFETQKTLSSLRDVITLIIHLPGIKCYHRNLYSSIYKCFDIAQTNSLSMFESMKLLKTRVRHQGRDIEGKCFGTTLLTKGLEFDSVILWDVHKFEDAKNFYVAISRARKKLILITESVLINFK